MSAVYPMPRNSLIWLLVAVLLSVVPQALRLPEWMFLVAVGCVVWRVQVFRQRWRFPGKLVRIVFIVLTTWGVFVHYGTLLGPDPGVALLIVAYLFKLLEMYQRRDAYVIVILSYFVLATTYLFDTSLLTSLFTLLICVAITAALLGLHQVSGHRKPRDTLLTAGLMLLQSLPLMLVLFVLVPRVGPIWTLSVNSEQARTGIGEEMTPGDITELAKSAEVAFRVEFDSAPPPREAMYWRGIVFSRFNGRTWYIDQLRFKKEFTKGDPEHFQLLVPQQSDPLRYQVIMKATYRDWLFAMPLAKIEHENTYLSQDLTWMKEDGVTANIIYQVESHTNYRLQPGSLHPNQRQHYLQLPSSGDLKSRAFAMRLMSDVDNDPAVFTQQLLAWIRTEPFSYTLSPPPLAGDTIDQFLFTTRNGFCAHYAGAMVFLLRSAGIPARMIVGYQGGTWHPSGDYLLIHQYDSHAWVEAWLPGQGWTRFDPTAAIAPERIFDGPFSTGSDESFSVESPLSPDRLRNNPLLTRLRNQLDYYDYLWTRWVVGYQQDTQNAFLSQFLGQVTPEKLVWLLGGVAGSVVALLAIVLLVRHRPRAPMHPADKLYLALCRRLARRGLRREQGEAPRHYAERIAIQLPDRSDAIREFTQLYEQLRYAPLDGDQAQTGSNATESNAFRRRHSVIMRPTLARMRVLLRQC